MKMSLMYYVTVLVLMCANFVVCGESSNGLSRKNKVGSRIVFPDTARSFGDTEVRGPVKKFTDEDTSKSTEEDEDIPLDLIRRLNEVSNITELFENYVAPIQPDFENLPLQLAVRIASEDIIERSAVRKAKMAKCMPELKTVQLKQDKTTASFYYPACTRVERCGGCCGSHLLSCQPVETEILHFSVNVLDYQGGNRFQFKGEKIVEVEQHTKCKCDCKIRPEDCSKYQKYSPHKCRCECTNTDEEKKCYLEGTNKLWNKENCTCECREYLECGSGFDFDLHSCSCLQSRPRKNQRPSFIYKID